MTIEILDDAGVFVDDLPGATPDADGRLELTRVHNPRLVELTPAVTPQELAKR